MEENSKEITDWQALAKTSLSIVAMEKNQELFLQLQPEKLVVSTEPITPDKYLIPKSSIKNFDNG